MSTEMPNEQNALDSLDEIEASYQVAPKMRTTSLPDVQDDVGIPDENEFQPLTPVTGFAQYERNQNALEEAQAVATDKPLIAPLESMATLRIEYENGSQMFLKQIDWLVKSGFKGVRRARGDGDCFYRSLAFAYIERLLQATEPLLAVTTAISVLEASKPLLLEAGFQALVFEDFYEELAKLINRIITPANDHQLLTPVSFLDAFNDPEVSNSIVMYFRLLTSAQIRADPGSFEAFLMDPETGDSMELPEFCLRFVESISKEADHVQMTALSRALKVNVSIAYLDGHLHGQEGAVDFVNFQNTDDEDTDPVILLYRPGHYDILDKRDQESLETVVD